jgi:hypothetical protein
MNSASASLLARGTTPGTPLPSARAGKPTVAAGTAHAVLARGTTPGTPGRRPTAAHRRAGVSQFTTLVLAGDHLTAVTSPRFAAAIVDFLARPG